ncbi:glycosyltransferase family 2 protein [Bacillus wiedmannii]|uniref:glycosyltransferase family 2 protein n=1 Tax=Bacillus wiedmannii TaxID=1890302 RepID=UPI003D968911
MTNKVAIVILNYKNIKETLRVIEEFKEQTEEIEIIVVDNNSQDESHDILSKKKDITYIQTNDNLGYAKGNNVGIKYAIENMNVSFIIVSNNDIHLPEKNTITMLKDTIRRLPSNWGYLGPTIKNMDGTLAQYFPKNHTTLIERFINSTLFGLPLRKVYNKFNIKRIKRESVFESEIVSGAFFLLNPKAVENIGAFDPYTFLYGEERILAKKYYQNGYKGFITHDVYVEHENAATTKKYPLISYVNDLKGEYYYFVKYKSINKIKQKLLILVRLMDTMIRVIIGNVNMKTLNKTLEMYIETQRELK